jgi:hypothetical protein
MFQEISQYKWIPIEDAKELYKKLKEREKNARK